MDLKTKEIKDLFVELTTKKIKSFDTLVGGYSNQCFLVNDAYVMKLPKDFVQPMIDYENEDNILYLLRDLKQVEKVLFYDYDKGLKLSKFIHNARPYAEEISNAQIILVAKFLKQIHKRKDESVKEFDPLVRLQLYKEEGKGKIDGRYERKIVNRVVKILNHEDHVICHNDLVRGNLLFSFDKLFVIDWELAGLNTIYFDLASFISENNLTKEQTMLFLKTYFGSSLGKGKIKKVVAFIEFEDILWYYWAMMMAKNCDEPIYQIIAKEKLEHVEFNKAQAIPELLK